MATSVKRRLTWYAVLAIVMLGGIGALVSQEREQTGNPEQTQAIADLRLAAALARDTRAELKNPQSFQLVQAVIQSDGSACISYRGTNSFNAVVTAQAVRPKRGATYWTSESNPTDFKKQWDAVCKGGGPDQTRMVQRLM
ncbi:MAG: hypothetical protein ACSLE9_17885 [Burkholderiaceae bacterium]